LWARGTGVVQPPFGRTKLLKSSCKEK
jgi:hypothetical protein